jgi:hypothetical protein
LGPGKLIGFPGLNRLVVRQEPLVGHEDLCESRLMMHVGDAGPTLCYEGCSMRAHFLAEWRTVSLNVPGEKSFGGRLANKTMINPRSNLKTL